MKRLLVLSYVYVVALAILAFAVPLGVAFARNIQNSVIIEVERQLRVLAAVLEEPLEAGVTDPALTSGATAAVATSLDMRVIVVDADGVLIGDSDGVDVLGVSYASRAELAGALRGQSTAVERRSEDLGDEYVFVAVPVVGPHGPLGAVRATIPIARVEAGRWQAWGLLGAISLVILGVGTVVGAALAGSFVRPVRRLQGAAAALADGDFTTRVPESGPRELAALAADVNSLAVRLESLVAAQSALLADLSHRLRTPMTALRLHLERAEDDPSALHLARDAVDNLQHMVNVLINEARQPVARIAQARLVDLVVATRDRLRFWQVIAAEQGRAVGVALAGEALPVRLSPEEAAEIVDCLVDNVFSHTDEGVGFGVEVRRVGDSAALVVVDAGDAPPPEMIARLFHAGVRGAGSEGTGFGLEIVARRVQTAGGRVRAYGGAMGGLAVELILPLAGPAGGGPGGHERALASGPAQNRTSAGSVDLQVEADGHADSPAATGQRNG